MTDLSKNNIKTIRLNKSVYTRPKKTITDSLQSPDKWREKLKGYNEVADIDYVTVRTHVRYFVYDLELNKWLFRTGGLLTKKHDKYVVLSNGKYSWSVQRRVEKDDNVYETKFFKILSKQELTEIALDKQQEEIQKLKRENDILRSQIYQINR